MNHAKDIYIRCITRRDALYLLTRLQELGYRWVGDEKLTDELRYDCFGTDTYYKIDDSKYLSFGTVINLTEYERENLIDVNSINFYKISDAESLKRQIWNRNNEELIKNKNFNKIKLKDFLLSHTNVDDIVVLKVGGWQTGITMIDSEGLFLKSLTPKILNKRIQNVCVTKKEWATKPVIEVDLY